MKGRPSRHADLMLRFAEGRGSKGAVKNRRLSWGDILIRLSKPTVTRETLAQFLKLPIEDQDKLKNINGFWIGAHCAEGRRNTKAITHRDIITFDIDKTSPELLTKVQFGLTSISHFEFAVHSTRKHTPEAPRLRIAVPLAKPIPIDMYNAAARVLASMLDPSMEAVDDVSFRPAQMMFYPSHSADSEFIWIHNRGILLDAAAMLTAWGDWRDYTKLPYAETQGQKRPGAKKAEDPTEKSGIVGAFCRAYPIEDAISAFLPDVYSPGDAQAGKPRYTFVAGSTSNGAVVEDDGLFLYSHHTSDPVSDRLVNSFDLVRIHKFGDLDPTGASDDTSPGKLPSFKKMIELATADEAVLAEFNPHLAELFDDEDVDVPANGHANGHTNGHVNGHSDPLTDDPEIASMLGLGPTIKLGKAKKKKLGPLEAMNQKHAVAMISGKAVLLNFRRKEKVTYSTPGDLHTLYANRPMPKATGGQEPISAWWLKQSKRRTYEGGIVFLPGNGPVPADSYNLWRGFAVAPDPNASCQLFLDHVLNMVCGGDRAQFEYIMAWLAHMVQRPQEKPGVAVILGGIKGAGKDTVPDYVGRLFPENRVKISEMDQLTGKFNAHQEKALLLHVEEGYWAGDPKAVGPMNRLITADTSMIEPKGLNAFEVASFCRVLITSNEERIVPASKDERRYAVFKVCSDRAQDREYFGKIIHERDNGGLGALLHYLQTFDLTGIDVGVAPKTKGLSDQKIANLKGHEAWWYSLLMDGELPGTGFDADRPWSLHGAEVDVDELYQSYTEWMRRPYQGVMLIKTTFGLMLGQMCRNRRIAQRGPRFDRRRVYVLPSLLECRQEFTLHLKAEITWPEIEDEEDLIG